MPTVRTRPRGHVNRIQATRVVLDEGYLNSLIDAKLNPHLADFDNPHRVSGAQTGRGLFSRLAIVDTLRHAGVVRPLFGDAWHWHPIALGTVLARASLRG